MNLMFNWGKEKLRKIKYTIADLVSKQTTQKAALMM